MKRKTHFDCVVRKHAKLPITVLMRIIRYYLAWSTNDLAFYKTFQVVEIDGFPSKYDDFNFY